MVSRFLSWLRGDDLDDRLDRLNAPLPVSVREAAGGQVVRWERDKPAWVQKNVHAYDREAYRKVSLIFAATQYMANAAGQAPLKVYRETEAGQQDEDPRHPFRELITRPNATQGESQFLAFVTMMATVSGFCVIEKERDQYGRVIGLWVLRSDWLRPIPKGGGVYDWQYTVPGYATPFTIAAEDSISVTYSDVPTGEVTGIGPVEVILREAQIGSDLTDFIKTFLDRGAMPLYFAIPVSEGPAAAQWSRQETTEAFRAKFRQTYGGLNNASDIMISPAIKDIKQLGFSFDELAYRDLRNVSETTICTAFGIPPILLSTMAGLEYATYSNYAQARRAFWEDTATAWLARLDDAFTRHLMPEFWPNEGFDIQFDVSNVPAMKDDENDANERANRTFASGLVSRHVAQRMAGIEPHGEDSFLVPFSALEVPVSGGRSARAIAAGVSGRISPGVRIHGSNGSAPPGRRYATPEERAKADQVAGKSKQKIDALAKVAEPRIRTFFDEQRDRIVAALTGLRSADDLETRAVETVDWLSEDEFFREAFRGFWEEVAGEAFTDISQLFDIEIDLEAHNPQLEELFDVLGERVTQINETTKQAVETVVRESLIDGASIDDLADNLSDLFDETYANRHITVARTESQVAFNLASQRAYQASGIVDEVIIYDNPNCHQPPGYNDLTCSQRNGLTVPVSEMEDHSRGAHPNCIIAFAPIVPEMGGGGT